MRPERPCPMHSPSFMVKFGGRSCKPVSTGSGLGTSVRRRRTGMGRVGSSSTQTGLTRSGGSGERFSNTRGSGVVVVPSFEMASRRVSVSDSRDAGADSDLDYMMMMRESGKWMTTSCCLLCSPYGVTVCGGAHARTLTRMPRQRQTVRVVHPTLNDEGVRTCQCAMCIVHGRHPGTEQPPRLLGFQSPPIRAHWQNYNRSSRSSHRQNESSSYRLFPPVAVPPRGLNASMLIITRFTF